MTVQQWAERAAGVLAGARRLMVVTGAGMSHDSGVPTFRDATTGLWARYDPQELATETAFRRNPARVFGWYLWRWHLVHGVRPHVGYHALMRLESLYEDCLIATQNVDGLHRRSGSAEVVELHGSLDAFRCLDRGHPYGTEDIAKLEAPTVEEVEPPRCPECDSPIRPGVVWFGEALPPDAVERAWSAVASCDALLVVGTAALVYPAADLPEIALRRGNPVVEINPDTTPLSPRATLFWPERAALALPALLEALTGALQSS
jgi:NAD-dependent deacetylase